MNCLEENNGITFDSLQQISRPQIIINKPLTKEQIKDIYFMLEKNKDKPQELSKLFTKSNGYSNIHESKCPITKLTNKSKSFKTKDIEVRPNSVKKSKVLIMKPLIPINTYKLHKTLFNIAKDEALSSEVIKYFSVIIENYLKHH